MPIPTKVRTVAIARGRTLKRVNALTSTLCGGVPAVLLNILFRTGPRGWLVGFAAGLLWANFFEYAYHRFLLHLPGTFFGQKHLEHHATVGTPIEAEHVNLGGSPLWVCLLFAVNCIPVVVVDLLLRIRIAPGVLVAFTIYFIVTEEFHWRIHLGGWLPPGFHAARGHHLAHHARPNARFNIFLPLWDRLLRTSGG
jgi:Fatty acid hydroxylase superfamily